MITQEVTEQKHKTKIIKERTAGNWEAIETITEQVNKTPLTVTKVITDQRTQALKSKGFDKVNEDLYVKRFDENMSQRLLFIQFKQNSVIKIVNREHNLDLGEVIWEGQANYLEDISDYLN